jgi:hypothetical protein
VEYSTKARRKMTQELGKAQTKRWKMVKAGAYKDKRECRSHCNIHIGRRNAKI